MSAVEIQRQLALSTAHLSRSTWRWLCEGEVKEHAGEVAWPWFQGLNMLVIPFEYGLILHCGADDPETPADLRAVLALARQYDCQWIKFDRDSDEIDGLPTYEQDGDALRSDSPDLATGKVLLGADR